MKNRLINNIFAIVGFIGSIITIVPFICEHLEIAIPKVIIPQIVIDFENIYANYGVCILLFSFFIFIFSLYSAIKIKIYNAKTTKKYDDIINNFERIIIYEKEPDYEYIADLIRDLYPYKNKSKINLAIIWGKCEETIYDTLNYGQWRSSLSKKYFGLKERFDKNPYDWQEYKKIFEKRSLSLYIGNYLEDEAANRVKIYIYGNSKIAFTKRKKKMIIPLLDTIIIFLYIVVERQNNQNRTMLE